MVSFGFKLALKWLFLGSNGFVFYRQNRHFTSVKSGDFCIFKMGLFRNFDVSSPEPPGGRSAGHRPGKLMLGISGCWSLDTWSFPMMPRGGPPLFKFYGFTKLYEA